MKTFHKMWEWARMGCIAASIILQIWNYENISSIDQAGRRWLVGFRGNFLSYFSIDRMAKNIVNGPVLGACNLPYRRKEQRIFG
jgi:hypothetical protein